MHPLTAPTRLVAQVRDALLGDIAEGRLRPGERIIQDQVAQLLGVSRQPVQQAVLLLRNEGLLRDAPGRGLIVAPIDVDHLRHLYDVRAMMEGLAFRCAAERNAACARKLGPALIRDGRAALESGSVAALIAADMRFHQLIHELSRNPLIAPLMAAQWAYTQRVMGEVLMRDGTPQEIWAQHDAMMIAVMDGDGDAAEQLAREHIRRSAAIVVARLQGEAPARLAHAANNGTPNSSMPTSSSPT